MRDHAERLRLVANNLRSSARSPQSLADELDEIADGIEHSARVEADAYRNSRRLPG